MRSQCATWPITLHFSFHGCRHKFPMDAQRLVFPSPPAFAVAALTYALLAAALPQVLASLCRPSARVPLVRSQTTAASLAMAEVLSSCLPYACQELVLHFCSTACADGLTLFPDR
jgi:hypothetical protein